MDEKTKAAVNALLFEWLEQQRDNYQHVVYYEGDLESVQLDGTFDLADLGRRIAEAATK